jgi:NADH-quinone oxidoreductase subunit I
VELAPQFRRTGDGAPAPAPAARVAAPAGAEPAADTAAAGGAPAAPADEKIEVDAQIDEAVFQELIAEGNSERVARAKAKAAYVRREKARLRAEREGSSA